MSTTIPIPRSHPSQTAHFTAAAGSGGLPSTSTPPAGSSISSVSSSRRASMLPPPLPHGVSFGSVTSTPSMHSPQLPQFDTGVGSGPGPQRLPRALTAAELHSQLEKEQEGIVNRLTRELSMLRSRSSDGESHERDSTHSSSRLRSSSQASSVSRHSLRRGDSTPPVHGHGYYTPTHATSAPVGNMPMSNLTGSHEFSLSSSVSSDVGGLEEAIRWKREMEAVSKENEGLRGRIKELERTVRELKKKRAVEKVEGGEVTNQGVQKQVGEGQALTEGNLRVHDKEDLAVEA